MDLIDQLMTDKSKINFTVKIARKTLFQVQMWTIKLFQHVLFLVIFWFLRTTLIHRHEVHMKIFILIIIHLIY